MANILRFAALVVYFYVVVKTTVELMHDFQTEERAMHLAKEWQQANLPTQIVGVLIVVMCVLAWPVVYATKFITKASQK